MALKGRWGVMEPAVRAGSLATAVVSRPGYRRLTVLADRFSSGQTIRLDSTQDTKTGAQIAGVAGLGWAQRGVDLAAPSSLTVGRMLSWALVGREKPMTHLPTNSTWPNPATTSVAILLG
jgi:hypothetical protein